MKHLFFTVSDYTQSPPRSQTKPKSGVMGLRTLLGVAVTSVLGLPLQNCSNGSSTFSEAPPSLDAQNIYNSYQDLNKTQDFKSSVVNVLGNDDDEKIKDSVDYDGKKYSNLRSNLKKIIRSSESTPKKNFKEFLANEKNIGDVQAKDFDLANKFYLVVISNLDDKIKYRKEVAKFSQLEQLRAIRAGAIMRALVDSGSTKKASLTNGNAMRLLETPVKDYADGIDTVANAAGSFGKSVADAHFTVQKAGSVEQCNHLMYTCNEQAKNQGMADSRLNAAWSRELLLWQSCQQEPPPYVCTYGEARDQTLRPANSTRGCSKFKIWNCRCNNANDKKPDGSFLHEDSKACEKWPESEHVLNSEAVEAAKPKPPIPSENSPNLPPGCQAYHALCKETVTGKL